ncbi:hypothetical protein [Pelagibius sp.]|uniref:hypothetical protein n=1 Tax=Pelagibius sp. TaxID=1931238 RepID=UPI0026317601|nr:hypothetical protein [Pelagibius sp.]
MKVSTHSRFSGRPGRIKRRGTAPARGRRGTSRAARGLALLFAGCLMALAGLVAEPRVSALAQGLSDPERVEESRDQILGSERFQTDRPEPLDIEVNIEPFQLPAWLGQAIIWTIVAIAVVMIAVFLYNAFQNRSGLKLNRDSAQTAPQRVDTPVRAQRKAIDARTLEEADALAAAGRFAEAIHLLLLVAMDHLRRDLGPRIAPALTGREILHLAALPQALAEPLGRMVSLSEIKHFGGRDAAGPDYALCRQDFLAFSGQPAAA